MQHVKPLVRQLAREHDLELFASKQQQKRVESIELVQEARDQQRQELAYNSRPFVLCGFPIRRPPKGTLRYVPRNGRFRLEVLGHPDYGVPFGQDRLIPLWIATLAVRQKSRMVPFRSAAEILEEVDLPKDGPHYRGLVDSFQRLFTSTIYFGTDNADGRQEVWDCRRFHFFYRLRIWCSRSADEDESGPGRCHHAKRTESVPLFGDSGLASQLGVSEYSRDRNFRKRLREWMKLVKLYCGFR